MLRSLELLVADARDTATRIGKDARHLKDLGKRAVVGARMAGVQARTRIDHGLERAADFVLDLEARIDRVKGSRRG